MQTVSKKVNVSFHNPISVLFRRKEEAARYLGVSVHIFDALIREGIIPTRVKEGPIPPGVEAGERFYLRCDLDAYLMNSLLIDDSVIKETDEGAGRLFASGYLPEGLYKHPAFETFEEDRERNAHKRRLSVFSFNW